MKIKTRLIIYNAIIVVVSGLLIFGVMSYAKWSNREIIRSFEEHQVVNMDEAHRPPELDFREPKEKAENLSNNLNIVIFGSVVIILALALLLSNQVFLKLNREAEAEKLAQTAKFEAARKTMVDGISHDLRTPLTVVKGNIKAIQDGVVKSPGKQKEYLETAYIRALDIENLLSKLFETFNYETGELNLATEIMDVNELVRDVAKKYKHSIDTKLDLCKKPLLTKVDKVEFSRVLDNLLMNAAKHNSEQKSLCVTIKTSSSDGFATIELADNGRGVKEENLTKIFDEFFKEDSSRGKDKQSSGLGLFVVKQIIAAHGGMITAKNENGLKFIIKLPRVKNE